MLTYAVLPDPRPDLPATALLVPTATRSSDPCRPRACPGPKHLDARQIAAHAVRHLADLTWGDPTVRHAAADPIQQQLWTMIHRAAACVAVEPTSAAAS